LVAFGGIATTAGGGNWIAGELRIVE
jgi:hypothetical protein